MTDGSNELSAQARRVLGRLAMGEILIIERYAWDQLVGRFYRNQSGCWSAYETTVVSEWMLVELRHAKLILYVEPRVSPRWPAPGNDWHQAILNPAPSQD